MGHNDKKEQDAQPMEEWKELIPKEEITDCITKTTIDFAESFGKYLNEDKFKKVGKDERTDVILSTTQLRKFYGEVKRQQMNGYNPTDFILLKPKLAYAVGRAKKINKIKDFYEVMSNAIDCVTDEKSFKNFIKIFEAIVAYHKKYEPNKLK